MSMSMPPPHSGPSSTTVPPPSTTAPQRPTASGGPGGGALLGGYPGATTGGRAARAPAAYIIVCGVEGGMAVELPLDSDGGLPLQTLQIEFTGAMGVKYRNPDTGLFRIMAPEDGSIYPPPGGWGTHHFIACCPKPRDERPWEDAPLGGGGMKRSYDGNGYDDGGGPFGKIAYLSQTSRSQYLAPGAVPNPRPGMVAGRGGFNAAKKAAGSPYNPSWRGKGPTPGPAVGSGYCKVCDIHLNSQQQQTAHFTGKKHKEKVDMANGIAPPKKIKPKGDGMGAAGPPGAGSGTDKTFASDDGQAFMDFSKRK